MAKVTMIAVNVKEGLPNYSSRGAEVTIVADDGESLPIEQAIAELVKRIKTGLAGKQAATKTKEEGKNNG